MQRREILPELAHAFVTVAIHAVVYDGVEEQQGIGPSGNLGVLTDGIEAIAEGSGRGQVPASGTATNSQTMRIDPQILGVLPNVANGALGIHETDIGRYLMRAPRPVLGADGDHAALGKMPCLGLKVTNVASIPATPEKEDRGRQSGSLGLARGSVALQDQAFVGPANLFIGDDLGIDGGSQNDGADEKVNDNYYNR